jgi:hypothetical protein
MTLPLVPTVAEFRGTMKPALRVRIPPPKQAATGNGQVEAKPAAPLPAAAINLTEIDVDDDLNDEMIGLAVTRMSSTAKRSHATPICRGSMPMGTLIRGHSSRG